MGANPVKYYVPDEPKFMDDLFKILSMFYNDILFRRTSEVSSTLEGNDKVILDIVDGELSFVYNSDAGYDLDLLTTVNPFRDGWWGFDFVLGNRVPSDLLDTNLIKDCHYEINLGSEISRWFSSGFFDTYIVNAEKDAVVQLNLAGVRYVEMSDSNNSNIKDELSMINSKIDQINKNLISHMRYTNYTFNGSVDSIDTISAWTSKDGVFHVLSDNVVYKPIFPFKLKGLFISQSSIKSKFTEIPWPLEQKIIDE